MKTLESVVAMRVLVKVVRIIKTWPLLGLDRLDSRLEIETRLENNLDRKKN